MSLKVGVVLGDDLMASSEEYRTQGITDMFSGNSFPSKKALMSCNAYLGAFPIAEALRQGCEVVITGRVVDSACVLGPLIYEFGWGTAEYDKLAAGTLAGHLVECGPQCCGGLFTDYEAVESWVNIGYPIVEVEQSGEFTVQKPPKTDGLISIGTVCEQMLYEIGDPGAYHVPDVACDFTQVQFEQVGHDVVRVTHVRGNPPTDTYKVVATHRNGFTAHLPFTIVGHDAGAKARRVASTLLTRWRRMLKMAGLPDFAEVRLETTGAGQYFRQQAGSREVWMRLGVRHASKAAIGLVSREWGCAGTSFAQGLCGGGGVFSMSETVSAFLFLVPKRGIGNVVVVENTESQFPVPVDGGFVQSASVTVQPTAAQAPSGLTTQVCALDGRVLTCRADPAARPVLGPEWRQGACSCRQQC